MRLPLPRLKPFACLALAAGSCAFAAPLEITVRDTQGQPLSDAVVSVEVKGERATAAPGVTGEMGQRNRQFSPTVLVVQTGTPVSFPNFDTVRHHVYSFSPVKTFEIKLYAGVPAEPIVFDKPGTAVLGCNIHDRMTGYVRVVGTSHFAKTDAAGHAVLDLPVGEHRLQAWHWRLPEPGTPLEQGVTVGAQNKPLDLRLGVGPAP